MRLILWLIKGIAKFVVVLLALLVPLLLVLTLLLFETRPDYHNSEDLSPENARVAAQFLGRVSRQIIQTQNKVKISASVRELNSLFQVIKHNYPRVHAIADFKNNQASVLLSLHAFQLKSPFYLNVSTTINNSHTGIAWSKVKIGKISLPDSFANRFFSRSIEIMLGKRYGRGVLNGIRDLQIQHQQVSLFFHPNEHFHQGISTAINRLSAYSGYKVIFETERVQYYLDFISSYAATLDNHKVSLSHILQVLLQETARQSSELQLAAERENSSALFALALDNANSTFKHFVRGIAPHHQASKIRLTLGGREDLAKHFIYSVALKLLSDSGLSLSIGETKEIHDSGSRGSGFSFADLAADKTGISFAEMATHSQESAARLHQFSQTELNENDFFPPLLGLPEGLSHAQFKEQYDSVNSPQYRALVEEIDQRIRHTRLSLFIHHNQASHTPAE